MIHNDNEIYASREHKQNGSFEKRGTLIGEIRVIGEIYCRNK